MACQNEVSWNRRCGGREAVMIGWGITGSIGKTSSIVVNIVFIIVNFLSSSRFGLLVGNRTALMRGISLNNVEQV